MDLPRQVIESIERRWAAKLQREVHAWKKQRKPHRESGDYSSLAGRSRHHANDRIPGHFKSITLFGARSLVALRSIKVPSPLQRVAMRPRLKIYCDDVGKRPLFTSNIDVIGSPCVTLTGVLGIELLDARVLGWCEPTDRPTQAAARISLGAFSREMSRDRSGLRI